MQGNSIKKTFFSPGITVRPCFMAWPALGSRNKGLNKTDTVLLFDLEFLHIRHSPTEIIYIIPLRIIVMSFNNLVLLCSHFAVMCISRQETDKYLTGILQILNLLMPHLSLHFPLNIGIR